MNPLFYSKRAFLLFAILLTITACNVTPNKEIDFENKPSETRSDSTTFLESYATQTGVQVTASGLHYKILAQGNGAKPKRKNIVEVHYRGTFPDGREFDSSYKRGRTAIFPVSKVIKGWSEALLLMNEGSKYELVIPPQLAYGQRGFGRIIPPKQVLVFEIELLNANIR